MMAMCDRCGHKIPASKSYGYYRQNCLNCKYNKHEGPRTEDNFVNQLCYEKALEELVAEMVEEARQDRHITAPLLPTNRNLNLTIKNVIFNDPATIVFWTDGTKTVVKCCEGDVFDPEKGLAMAISKRVFGGSLAGFKKWLPEEESSDALSDFEIIITKEDIQAQLDGKMLATTINGDKYFIFVKLEKGEPDD